MNARIFVVPLVAALSGCALFKGEPSIRDRIAAECEIVGEDEWYGGHRIQFMFQGRKAWVVEPSGTEAEGRPWTWTIQWWTYCPDRSGVPGMLKRGYHHVMIDGFKDRGDENAMKLFSDYHRFLVEKLGFAQKTRLIGMSWGGFMSIRYAARFPERVAKIYLDAPLLNFDAFVYNPVLVKDGFVPGNWEERIGVSWAKSVPAGGWTNDPRMPINMAGDIARAKIPILLLYGCQDQSVDPKKSCEPFAERFKAAGGDLIVERRPYFGHHPHGLDPDKTAQIEEFFCR